MIFLQRVQVKLCVTLRCSSYPEIVTLYMCFDSLCRFTVTDSAQVNNALSNESFYYQAKILILKLRAGIQSTLGQSTALNTSLPISSAIL